MLKPFRILKPCLIGDTYREVGDVVEVGESKRLELLAIDAAEPYAGDAEPPADQAEAKGRGKGRTPRAAAPAPAPAAEAEAAAEGAPAEGE